MNRMRTGFSPLLMKSLDPTFNAKEKYPTFAFIKERICYFLWILKTFWELLIYTSFSCGVEYFF